MWMPELQSLILFCGVYKDVENLVLMIPTKASFGFVNNDKPFPVLMIPIKAVVRLAPLL